MSTEWLSWQIQCGICEVAKAYLGSRLCLGICCPLPSTWITLLYLWPTALWSKEVFIWPILVLTGAVGGLPGMYFMRAVVTWAAAPQDGSEPWGWAGVGNSQPSGPDHGWLQDMGVWSTADQPWLNVNTSCLKTGKCLESKHHFRIVTGAGQNVDAQTHISVSPKTWLYFPSGQLPEFSRYWQLRAFSDSSCNISDSITYFFLGAL